MNLREQFEKKTNLSAIIGDVKGQDLYHTKYTEWLEQRLRANQHDTVVMFKQKSFDYRETVLEEIKLFTGLDAKPYGKDKIKLDTIAGQITYMPMGEFNNVMADVYRFISHYGSRLQKWGLEKKVKELDL